MSCGPHVGLGGKDCCSHDQEPPISIEDETDKQGTKEVDTVLAPSFEPPRAFLSVDGLVPFRNPPDSRANSHRFTPAARLRKVRQGQVRVR
jgi:hypothetical protein